MLGKITSINIHKKEYYNLTIKTRNTTQYRSAKITTIEKQAKVFCPTTFTGFFIVRRNNRIYISGNSGDLHTTVTKMTMRHLPWGSAPDREIAERPFYRHFDYRFMSKKLGHGSNYLGQPPKMAAETKFPIQSVKDFQEAYFNAFPCIPAWHQSVFYNLINLGFIETLFGDRRYFFGRPKEGSTQRDAVAHAPQSMTAKEINTGILNLWRGNRVQLLMQVHDSILFQYPEEQEDEIIPWALEQLKVYLELKRGRKFFVPVDAKTGWNWGNESIDNPDGLKKWKGSDSRKRVENGFRLSLIGL